ncbi:MULTISPECIES: TraR/DksA family transcriptional regulator [unclassified Psychrobacter]|uniref:TraR/DksA family transcriptional regulator n=1 Tax=unclassified Psychrobacter TaxID=196806 RepID=UPI0018F59483|nr:MULTISPECIES: TraR/DksA C4-type zinc finger protein [unclassified Psychrobacter]
MANDNNDLYQDARERLLTLQEEYRTRIEAIEDHIQNPQDDLNEHWEDQAISYRQNDMRKNLLAEAQQNLMYVENALSRIENGTYGECEVCGEDIEPKRLEAIPYATLCMQHAE